MDTDFGNVVLQTAIGIVLKNVKYHNSGKVKGAGPDLRI